MLHNYQLTTDGSELERAAALPFEVVGGFIEGITQRGALFDARSTLLEKEIQLLEKRKEAAQRLAALSQERRPAGAGTLFSFSAGTPVAGTPVVTINRPLTRLNRPVGC